MAFFLPRKRLAAFTATWPRIWLLASMIHHLRGTSLAFAENVFIRAERARKLRAGWGAVNCLLSVVHAAPEAMVRSERAPKMAPQLLIIAINAPLVLISCLSPPARCSTGSCSRRKIFRCRRCLGARGDSRDESRAA